MTWKCHVTTLFFQSVSNSSDVRDKCVRGDLKANVEGTDGALTIVKSSLVYSPTQVNVAVMKAASAYLSNAMPNESDGSKRLSCTYPLTFEDIFLTRLCFSSTMKTRSLDTEIVYFLSPSKSISDSLRQYGVGDGDSALCAICVVLVNGKTTRSLSLLNNKFSSEYFSKEMVPLALRRQLWLTNTNLLEKRLPEKKSRKIPPQTQKSLLKVSDLRYFVVISKNCLTFVHQR